MEYGEPWHRSLLVIGFWLATGIVLLLLLSRSSSTDCSLVPGSLRACEDAAQENLVWTALLALVCLASAAIFTWRRLFRRPGLRLDEVGFENRTQVFRVQPVRWQDVRTLHRSRRHLFWQTMDVGLKHSVVPEGRPTFTTIGLSGLSKTPGEIEAEMTDRVEQAHRDQQQLAESLLVDGDRILHGIRVVTEDDQTHGDISSDRLYKLICDMEPGDSIALEMPVLRHEDQSVKVSRTEDGTWRVEYRNRDGDYRDECDEAATLHAALVGWADDSPDWRDRLGRQRGEN